MKIHFQHLYDRPSNTNSNTNVSISNHIHMLCKGFKKYLHCSLVHRIQILQTTIAAYQNKYVKFEIVNKCKKKKTFQNIIESVETSIGTLDKILHLVKDYQELNSFQLQTILTELKN